MTKQKILKNSNRKFHFSYKFQTCHDDVFQIQEEEYKEKKIHFPQRSENKKRKKLSKQMKFNEEKFFLFVVITREA